MNCLKSVGGEPLLASVILFTLYGLSIHSPTFVAAFRSLYYLKCHVILFRSIIKPNEELRWRVLMSKVAL